MGATIDPFSFLLAPQNPESFFADTWEKKPLVVSRQDRGYYSRLLSLADVDQLLNETGIRKPSFRLVKDGAEIKETYTIDISCGNEAFSETVDIDKVLSQYQNGVTVVLQGLHRQWAPLKKFCRGLENYLTHSVQANAYLTPRGAQGFAAHYDTHDVFVLQTSGEKVWRLYGSPINLPHKQQPHSKGADYGRPVEEFVLRAGDLIYIPRGFVHEALTTDSHSLHITIGVPMVTWVEVISKLAEKVVDDELFRQSLPRGYARSTEATIAPELASQLHSRLVKHFSPVALANEMLDAGKRFVANAEPDRRGTLLAYEEGEVARNTRVRGRHGTILRVETDDIEVKLQFEGKEVALPKEFAELIRSLELLLKEGVFTASHLLDSVEIEGRVTLVNRLLKEGLLVLDEP